MTQRNYDTDRIVAYLLWINLLFPGQKILSITITQPHYWVLFILESVPEIQMGLFANPLNSFISKCQMMQIPHGLVLLDLLIFLQTKFSS